MLDLSIYPIQKLAIKLEDGSVINLLEPSISMKNYIGNTIKDLTKLTDDNLEKAMLTLVSKILNNNDEDKKIDSKYIKKLNTRQIEALINEYANFINEIQKNPN